MPQGSWLTATRKLAPGRQIRYFQNSKVPKFQKFQSFKSSRTEVAKFQNFKVSNFRFVNKQSRCPIPKKNIFGNSKFVNTYLHFLNGQTNRKTLISYVSTTPKPISFIFGDTRIPQIIQEKSKTIV